MLLFAPFASLDYETSRLIFSILIFAFIIANTALANYVFFKEKRSIYSFLFIFIVIMLLPGTNSIVNFVQTNFILCFFLLLVMLKINKPSSGFYLALSFLIKPISAFLILFFIINKKWKSVIATILTTLGLFLLTIFFWGGQNIIDYIKSPPTNRLPHFLYVQDINASLIAILNRNLHSLSQNYINLLYYSLALILIILTIIISKKLRSVNFFFSLFPFVLCMLMIYPSSLDHYMIFLFPFLIYFLLLENSEKYFWIIIIPFFSFLRTEAFFSYLLLWTFMLYLGLFKSENKKILEAFNLKTL